MRKIKEILRLKWEANLSARKIASSCSISHHTVAKILKAAEDAGVNWPLPEELDDAALENLLYPEQPATASPGNPPTIRNFSGLPL